MVKTKVQHLKRKTVILTIFILLLVISFTFVVIHRGFYYADYHTTWQLHFPEDTEISVIDAFSGSSYVASVDRVQKIVELQNISETELNRLTSDLNSTGVTLSISTKALPANLPMQIISGIVLLTLTALGATYFSGLRELLRFKQKEIYTLFLWQGIAWVWGLTIQIGVMSFFSRFYKLTDLSIISLFIYVVWSTFLITANVTRIYNNYQYNIPQLNELFIYSKSQLKYVHRRGATLWTVFIFLLTLALGVHFSIDGFLLITAVIISGESLTHLPGLLRSVWKRRTRAANKTDKVVSEPNTTKNTSKYTKTKRKDKRAVRRK